MGENTLVAKSGDVVSNTIKLKGVEKHNYAYDLPEGNEAANWFNDPEAVAAREAFKYPKGYYSVRDKISDLMQNPEAAAVVKKLMDAAMSGRNTMADMMPKKKAGEENPMAGFIARMRLNDLLKMAGEAGSTKNRLAINEALNKIKKN